MTRPLVRILPSDHPESYDYARLTRSLLGDYPPRHLQHVLEIVSEQSRRVFYDDSLRRRVYVRNLTSFAAIVILASVEANGYAVKQKYYALARDNRDWAFELEARWRLTGNLDLMIWSEA